MENTGSILAIVLTALAVAFVGYRIKKEREKLREIVATLGDDDANLIHSLETMVHGGELSPVAT